MLLLQEVEKDVKARTKGDLGAAKTLCTPFDQPDLPEGMKLACGLQPFQFLFCCCMLAALTCA
jgi:prolyl-tRNA synthetase